MPTNRVGIVLLLCLAPLPLLAAPWADDEKTSRGKEIEARLQDVTDDLRRRLEILAHVTVTLVDHNPLVLSVETTAGRGGPFVISVDRAFIEELEPQEVEAALAHELGHVWIHTHHPYLQTERLANDIAMRVISGAVLGPVYEKVWRRIGVRGNLEQFVSRTGGQ